MKSLCGFLLAASPRMMDSCFEKTVILVVQHDQRGALGVVLNQSPDMATWKKGHLEDEISSGDWLVVPATRAHLLSRKDNLWQDVVLQVGRSVLSELNLRHIPSDPLLN